MRLLWCCKLSMLLCALPCLQLNYATSRCCLLLRPSLPSMVGAAHLLLCCDAFLLLCRLL